MKKQRRTLTRESSNRTLDYSITRATTIATTRSKVCNTANDEDGWTRRSWERRPLVIGVGVIPVGAAGQRSRGTRAIRGRIHQLVGFVERPEGKQNRQRDLVWIRDVAARRGQHACCSQVAARQRPASCNREQTDVAAWFLNHRFLPWFRLVDNAKDEVIDGWKGGDAVNGRYSRVRVAKGHRRSRGQLVRRVKGFPGLGTGRSFRDRIGTYRRASLLFPTRPVSFLLDTTGSCVNWITRRSAWLMTTGPFYSHNHRAIQRAIADWFSNFRR